MKINKRKLLGWILVSPTIIFIVIIYSCLFYLDYKAAVLGLLAAIVLFGAIRGLFILGEESGKGERK